MRFILLAITLLYFTMVEAQQRGVREVYEVKAKRRLHYVLLGYSEGQVYKIGSYFDKAGSGNAILFVDSLKSPDSTGDIYLGTRTRIVTKEGQYYLIENDKPDREWVLVRVHDIVAVNRVLNNAYYLDKFSKMAKDINNAYPLFHYSFRHMFASWDSLPDKDLPHHEFVASANLRTNRIKDSITRIQDAYVTNTGLLITNIKTISYDALKSGLEGLPAEYKSSSWYFGTVVNEVSRNRPEYFFRLVEDLPSRKGIIFAAVENDKQIVQNILATEGNPETKKEFLKDRRFAKTFIYRTLGLYVLVIGLVVVVVVSS